METLKALGLTAALCASAAVVSAPLAWWIAPAYAQDDTKCAPRDELLPAWAEKFGETPHAAGLTTDGNLAEIWVSPEGGWTAFVTRPDGVSCFTTSGTGWVDSIETPAAGDPA